MRYMVFHHIRLSLNGLCTMYTFGIIVALGCPSLLWRQLDPFKMIPDLSVSRPAKSFTFLCGRLRSIRHGRKTCGRPQTCRKHTLEANFYFRPDCLGGKTFAKTPLAEVVSPVPPALGHRDRVGEMFRHFRLAKLSPFARHTDQLSKLGTLRNLMQTHSFGP